MTSMPLRCSSFTRAFNSSTCIPICPVCRITRLRREKAQGAVAPIITQPLARFRVGEFIIQFVELVNRHQFHAVDPQFFEIGDLLANTGIGTGELDARGWVAGQAAHVHLVDDQLFQRRLQGTVVDPIEIVLLPPSPAVGRWCLSSGGKPHLSRPLISRRMDRAK